MSSGFDQQGETLERWRHYLTLLACAQIDPHLRDRIDVSGVVQWTLMEAHQNRAQIEGQDSQHQTAWLRKILATNLADEMRQLMTEKRNINREQSIEARLEASSIFLEQWLVAEQSSPSHRAQRSEQSLRVAEALASLPEAQREALILQHWHGWSLAEIGQKLERTPAAVAGLLKRGLKQLRILLQNEE